MRSTTKSMDYYRDTRCREFMQRFVTTGEMSTLSSSSSSTSPTTPAGQVKLPAHTASSSTSHSNTATAPAKSNLMETT